MLTIVYTVLRQVREESLEDVEESSHWFAAFSIYTCNHQLS